MTDRVIIATKEKSLSISTKIALENNDAEIMNTIIDIYEPLSKYQFSYKCSLRILNLIFTGQVNNTGG